MLSSIGVMSAMSVINAIEENRKFNELCKSLPNETASFLRKNRAARLQKEDEHRKALEIANASRPRNFWGQ